MVLGRRTYRPYSYRSKRFRSYRSSYRPRMYSKFNSYRKCAYRGKSRPSWLRSKMYKPGKAMKSASLIFDMEPATTVQAGGVNVQATPWGALAWEGYYGVVAGQAPAGNGIYSQMQKMYPQLPVGVLSTAGLFKAEHINDAFESVHPAWANSCFIKAVKFTVMTPNSSICQPIFSLVHKANKVDQFYTDSLAQRAANAAAPRMGQQDFELKESINKRKVYVKCMKRDTPILNPYPGFPAPAGRVTNPPSSKWTMPDVYFASASSCRMKVKIYYRIKNID